MAAEIVFLVLATLMGVLVQTIAGFGFPLFVLPVMLVYFFPPAAVTTTLLAASVLCILVLFAERRQREFSWPIVLTLLAASIPGLVLGGIIVTTVRKEILQMVVGVLIILTVLIQQYFLPKPKKALSVSSSTLLAGLVAGILNTSTSVAGPAISVWMRSHVVTKNQIRDTLAVSFLGLNAMGIVTIYFFRHSSLNGHGVLVFVLLAPLIVGGHQLSSRMAKNIHPENYRIVAMVAVVGAGFASFILGAINL